jgi:hypothetical protein
MFSMLPVSRYEYGYLVGTGISIYDIKTRQIRYVGGSFIASFFSRAVPFWGMFI